MSAAPISQSQQVMAIGLMAALAVMFFPSLGTWDILIWLRWTDEMAAHGLVGGYAINPLEYPPLGFVWLWLSATLADVAGVHAFYGIKTGLLLFLLATTVILYRQAGRDAGSIFFYYVALLLSALALSYLDIYLAPFLLLAFAAWRRERWQTGLLLFAIAVLTKYSAIIMAPFVLLYFLSMQRQRSAALLPVALQAVWPSLLLVMALLLVFGREPLDALGRAFGHSDLSANALNFNWVQTRLIQLWLSGRDLLQAYNMDSQLLRNPPLWAIALARALFGVFYLLALAMFWRRQRGFEDFLLFSLLGHLAYFMFNIGVHENHLFLSMLLVMALAHANPAYRLLAINVCLISSLNLFAFHSYNGNLPDLWRGVAVSGWEGANVWMNGGPPFDFRLLLAFVNVLFFFSLWFAVWRQGKS